MTLLFASLFPFVSALDLSGAVAPVQPEAFAARPAVERVVEAALPIETAAPSRDVLKVKATDPVDQSFGAPEDSADENAFGDVAADQEAYEDPMPLETLAPPAPIVPESVVLAEVSRKLRETETARGGFIQTDAYGQTTTGDFYIRRPGRIRFGYAKPAEYLVVSDGTTVAVEDKRLETMDRAPLGATPLKLFLNQNVDLARDTEVMGVHSLPDAHLVVVRDKTAAGQERVEGELMLQFDRETYDLEGWIAIDGAGGETRISLIDVETNVKIPARYFVIVDPEDDDRRR